MHRLVKERSSAVSASVLPENTLSQRGVAVQEGVM